MSNDYSISQLPEWIAIFIKEDRATNCWNWTGGTSEGYGCIGLGKIKDRLHRVVWKLANGDIPNGLYVLHTCDNRRCCNPAHLFLGTCGDNIRDMWKKGRGILPTGPAVHGEQNGHAKLTDGDVATIKLRRSRGELLSALAKEYGVCDSTICKLAKGRRWKHIA